MPLISLANILHNAKLWNDAVVVATMAVEIAPHFAVNHFTLGNVYVAMVRLGGASLVLMQSLTSQLTLNMSLSSSFPEVLSPKQFYTDRNFIHQDLRDWVVVVMVMLGGEQKSEKQGGRGPENVKQSSK